MAQTILCKHCENEIEVESDWSIVLSKEWNKPYILIRVIKRLAGHNDIEIAMSLKDFRTVLKQELIPALSDELKREIGSVTWVFKKDTFDAMIDLAVQKVVAGGILDALTSKIMESVKRETVAVSK